MSRLLKMKRRFIFEANKKLLGESLIDEDNVLYIMKFKFGWGDLSPLQLEEFESWLGEIKEGMTDEEYATLFDQWLTNEGTEYEDDDDINLFI
jgi:hypothetical protein